MIGKHEKATKICPTCGGTLATGQATIPFIVSHNIIIVIKHIPADICQDCYEPFVAGNATDHVLTLLRQLKSLKSEVSVVTYSQQMQYAMA
jgi:YgiT-type zinc finger domain-containing protein